MIQKTSDVECVMQTIIETEEHAYAWRVSAESETLPALFTAIAEVIAGSNPCAAGVAGEWEHVSLQSDGPGSLLVEWANELLQKSESDQCAYAETRDVSVTIERTGEASINAWIRAGQVSSWSSPLRSVSPEHGNVERMDGHWRAVLLFNVWER